MPDAEILQFKSGLIGEIQRIIKARGLTQSEAAKITGMDQPTLAKGERTRLRSGGSCSAGQARTG